MDHCIPFENNKAEFYKRLESGLNSPSNYLIKMTFSSILNKTADNSNSFPIQTVWKAAAY